MQTYSIKWNYSSYKAGVFLYKCSPRAKHNWHCTIGFLINTASLYFIQHYHLFFFNESIFFECLYFSEYDIFECCYSLFDWEIGHPLSPYATGGMEGVIQNVCWCVQGGGVSHLMCTYVLTRSYSFHSLMMSWRKHCLIVSCFICRKDEM